MPAAVADFCSDYCCSCVCSAGSLHCWCGVRVGCCRRSQKLHIFICGKIMWSQNTRSTLFFRFQMPNSQTTSVYGVLFCRALVFDALMDAGCWLVQVGCIVRHSQLDAACTCCVCESVSTISRFHFTFITLRVISMHFKFFCLTLLMRGSIWLLLFFCSWFVFCCCCLECPQQNTYNNHYFLHERQTQE